MSAPICVECMIEMNVLKNGVLLAAMNTRQILYTTRCDVHHCPQCCKEIIVSISSSQEHSDGWTKNAILAEEQKGNRVIYYWLNSREKTMYFEEALIGEQEEIPF